MNLPRVSRELRIITLGLFALLLCGTTLQAQTVTKDITFAVEYGSTGNRIANVILFINVSDAIANSTLRTNGLTNGNGSYTLSYTFKCNSNGMASGGVGVNQLLPDGNIGRGGGWGGGFNCTDTSPVTLVLNGIAASNYNQQEGGISPPNGCLAMKGEPVNVMNGNMYVRHSDYSLPTSVAEGISINRSYNSLYDGGRFGVGWKSELDERVVHNGAYPYEVDYGYVKYFLPDGRVSYAYNSGNYVYKPLYPDIYYQITWDVQTDFNFTVYFNDGSKSRFRKLAWDGLVLWREDRKGNRTTFNYDGDNRLTSIVDPFGRTVTVSTNTNRTISALSDSVGTIANYEYEPGTTRLKTVTFPDSSKYKFEYISVAGSFRLKRVKDALDNVLENHEYDTQGRAITSDRHGGVEKYTFDYTNANLDTNAHTIVTDAEGNVSKYYFDKSKGKRMLSRIEGVCSCGGGGSETTTFEYDNGRNLTKITDALAQQTSFTHDSRGNVLSVTDNLGVQTFTYNSFGQVLTHRDRVDSQNTDPTVFTAALTYNSGGDLVSAMDRLGHTTTLTYSSIGQLATVTDARSKTTTFTYDTQGRLIAVANANNKDTTFGYDARARLTGTTNAKNETTTFEYDLNNRLKKVTFPDTNYIEHAYDLAGRRTATRDPRGNSTTYGYDDAYRLTSVTDPLNHTRTFGYDLMSNLTSQTDGLGNTTNFEYDDFNRVEKIIYPPAAAGATRLEENITYDKLGNVKTRVDTAGRTTSYLYDTSNRLTKITDALTNQTQFEYNLRSQLTKVKDALNQEYVFTYDPLGRTLSQTRAGTTMSFEYDDVGNRTKRTDYSGRVTNYEYDDLNRLTTLLHGTIPESTFTYDDLSRLLTATSGAGTVTFTYDNRSRLESETDVFGRVLEYDYDANGNRTSLELDGSTHTTYAYDVANRLTTLTDDASQSYTYGYDISDRLISKALPNGITTTFDYDGMSRLTRLKDATTGSTLLDRQYSYNTANQISAITEPSRTRTFGYDNINRLTSATDSALGSEAYAFDSVGNRTSSPWSSTYTHLPFNRLTATQTATYSLDSNGNMTSKVDGLTSWAYTWDRENRLTNASSGAASVDYLYDALGRRVRRIDGSDTTEFTHDGDDVLLDDSSVSGISKFQNGPGIDNKLSVKVASTTNYFLADHLGSTNALTDSTGAITASQTYDGFGYGSNGAFPSRYQFTGREYDPTIGLQFSRARFYDPKLGRFISEDPIGFGGGDINLYGYVWNNPQNFTDPTGNAAFAVIAYAVFEFCATGYDFYDFYSTLSDPNSDSMDVGMSGGGILLGAVMPAGGYGSAGKGLRKYFGRRGSPTTRDQLDEVRDQVLDANPDYRHVGGGRNRITGGDIPEEFIRNPNGGRRGGSYPDLTFEGPDGSKIRINTVDTNMNGLPTGREADAADRMRRNTGGSPILIPKKKCVPCKE